NVTVKSNPTVESTSPSSRGQGASKQSVTIKGKGFVSGAKASFGSGTTVESTSFVSATELKATISVEASAATGPRTVTVTNPDDAGTGSLTGGFTVNAGPSVESTSPNSGDLGGTENVTVKGASFVSGATPSFGTGVKVNSTTFESSSQLKVSVSIES